MPEPCEIDQFATLALDPEIEKFLRRFPDIPALRFHNDELMVREGDVDQDIYLVLTGSYIVEQTAGDHSVLRPSTLAMISSDPATPTFVGEMAYLGAFPRTASVRCVGAVVALRLRPAHLDTILESYPGLTRLLCRQFTVRLKETSEHLSRLEQLTTLNARHLVKKAGETVLARGEAARTLFQLVDGVLEIEGWPDPITPGSLEGGFLALGEYLRGAPHTVTVKAKTTSMLVAIDESSRLAVVRSYPALALAALE